MSPPSPRLLAFLEYGLVHLLGISRDRREAFLNAAKACFLPALGEWDEVQVDTRKAAALERHHQELAELLLRALNAEDDYEELMFLRVLFGCRSDKRSPDSEDPQVDPELLHLGIVVAENPDDKQVTEGKRSALFLACPPDEAVALPLLYLLRERLREDRSLENFAVHVLPPDLKLAERQEELIITAAKGLERLQDSAGFDARAELEWLPRSYRGPAKGMYSLERGAGACNSCLPVLSEHLFRAALRRWLRGDSLWLLERHKEDAKERIDAVALSPVRGRGVAHHSLSADSSSLSRSTRRMSPSS